MLVMGCSIIRSGSLLDGDGEGWATRKIVDWMIKGRGASKMHVIQYVRL